jgi:site-specific recombinase XerD
MNRGRDYSKLTPRNRDFLIRIFNDCVLKANSKARSIAKVERLAISFLLFGDRNVEDSTKTDFQDVFTQIMRDPKISESTKKIRIDEIKRMDKEYFGGGENYTDRTKWMKFAKSSKSKYLPEEILTEKEALKIISSAASIRDKALLNTLWSTGARIGEIGNLKVKNFEYLGKCNEAHLMLNGKTGMRKVLIIEPVLDILAWLDIHPLRSTPDFKEAFMFCKTNGHPLTHACAEKIIRVAMKRADVKKRHNPHMWRHSRATNLCGRGLGEMQMRHYFGWAKGSDMPATYIHLSQVGLDSALKKSLGLEDKQDEEVVCKVCTCTNTSSAKNCTRCGRPLSIEGYIQLDQEKKLIEQDRNISQRVFFEAFKLINEQKMSPGEAQKEAVKIVAGQLRVQGNSLKR